MQGRKEYWKQTKIYCSIKYKRKKCDRRNEIILKRVKWHNNVGLIAWSDNIMLLVTSFSCKSKYLSGGKKMAKCTLQFTKTISCKKDVERVLVLTVVVIVNIRYLYLLVQSYPTLFCDVSDMWHYLTAVLVILLRVFRYNENFA